jgi:hypothetical protein
MPESIYKVISAAAAACLCLLLMCLVPVAPFTAAAPAAGSDIIFGDINGDGHINVGDAILLLRHIVGLTTLEPDQVGRANVSASYDAAGSPTLDVGDAILVLRRITGLIGYFPAESAAFFTHFSLGLPGETVWLDPADHKVTLMVPYSAGSLENKTALFGLPYGVSASVGGLPQVSGVTLQDFRAPVLYEIIAPNGSAAALTVTTSRWGEASGHWLIEGLPPLFFMYNFRVSVSGLECATHYEVYVENEEGELVSLGDRTVIGDPVTALSIVFQYPERIEVSFYDSTELVNPVVVARCTGAENATAGDLIFDP